MGNNEQNQWDNSTVGNYWDDNDGEDMNNDGIVDEPYLITGSTDEDRYPLVNEISSIQIPANRMQITIDYPLDHIQTSGNLIINGTTLGNPDIIILQIDNQSWYFINASKDWSFTLDTTSLENGDHTISVKAQLNDVFETKTQSVTIQVNNEDQTNGTPGFLLSTSILLSLILTVFVFKRR
jgi:hypothetical protein